MEMRPRSGRNLEIRDLRPRSGRKFGNRPRSGQKFGNIGCILLWKSINFGAAGAKIFGGIFVEGDLWDPRGGWGVGPEIWKWGPLYQVNLEITPYGSPTSAPLREVL